MAFIETPRFPDDISYGSTGGPSWATDVLVLKSGYESRNINWGQARYSYNAAMGVRDQSQLDDLISWFNTCQGMAHGFRFRDWTDYTSSELGTNISDTDQLLGTGDGIEVDFQLVKNYTQGLLNNTRVISKPEVGSVIVAVAGVSQPSGWSVDTTTGIITFDVAPVGDVTAGYLFDVPARFNTDSLVVSIDHYNTGSMSVPIIEIRV